MGEFTQNTWKNLPKISHLIKIKWTMKQWSRHQSSTTAEPDHQTFTYSITARAITVGPFCPSHIQTHVSSLGCFMYSGKKQHSANACLHIYIWAARSHLDGTLAWKGFGIRSIKAGRRSPEGEAGSDWFHYHTTPFVSGPSKQEVSCQQFERRDLCSAQRATYFALLRDLLFDSSGAYLCYIFKDFTFSPNLQNKPYP